MSAPSPGRPPGPSVADGEEPLLWVVGKVTGVLNDEWDFIGVFDDELRACAQCRSDRYFVAPARLNFSFDAFPDGSLWPGGYFPLVQAQVPYRIEEERDER